MPSKFFKVESASSKSCETAHTLSLPHHTRHIWAPLYQTQIPILQSSLHKARAGRKCGALIWTGWGDGTALLHLRHGDWNICSSTFYQNKPAAPHLATSEAAAIGPACAFNGKIPRWRDYGQKKNGAQVAGAPVLNPVGFFGRGEQGTAAAVSLSLAVKMGRQQELSRVSYALLVTQLFKLRPSIIKLYKNLFSDGRQLVSIKWRVNVRPPVPLPGHSMSVLSHWTCYVFFFFFPAIGRWLL